MKPTFIVIGAAKSATSSLCSLLSQHPDVFMVPRKELHYFSFDEAFERGPAWYEGWFEGADRFKQVGEGSTTYSAHGLFPRAAARMAEYAPDVKLIYIVRNPLERMESLWLQLRRLGVAPFQHAGLSRLPAEMRVDLDFNTAVKRQSKCIVDTTNYWREICAYREHFADEQIHVLLFEELEREPRAAMQRCFEFLGVDAGVRLREPGVHLNRIAEYRHPRSALWRMWSTAPGRRLYSAAKRLLPRALRSQISRHMLSTPVLERPQWDPAVREWALSRLRDDAARFLAFYGYPLDSWQLGPIPGDAPQEAGRAQGLKSSP